MTRYVALLRAINVGGRTVKMDALRREFEASGARNVETFIASGNVIFDSSRKSEQAAERALEDHIRSALGYPVVVFLRSIPELAAIAERAPFTDSDYGRGGRLFVAFMKSAADRSVVRAIAALRTDIDEFVVAGREIYWLRRAELMASLGKQPSIERAAGSPITMRGINTVRRLAKKYCDA